MNQMNQMNQSEEESPNFYLSRAEMASIAFLLLDELAKPTAVPPRSEELGLLLVRLAKRLAV